ncbi:MAG: hypothetical protein AB2385_02535 [Symbiobacterium sp.]|uniref:hypothetical protein n=1 Tax=Symbiobacterium sp. TaxID=1971213 RepID=UPI003464B130
MSVRPIDSLTMLPRLTEAGRAVQQVEQYPHAFQQVLGAQVQQDGERSQKQVRRRTEAEGPVVNPDARQGGAAQTGPRPGDGRRRRQAPASRQQPEDGSSLLDVKV